MHAHTDDLLKEHQRPERRVMRRCADCDTPSYLPSLLEARRCYRCGCYPTPGMPKWKVVCFGRIRKVPPAIGRQWP